ncbi:MAG: hypothetical protein DRP01_00200 [Archaeoglobales archaeon]|nr:MAG: hypothetical protein DRP01_00200 [Archaeoglobales archaeon]
MEKKPATTTIDLPDGEGGWVKTEAVKHEGSKQDPEKVDAAMEKARRTDFFKSVGRCTEALNTYLKIYSRDHGLSPEEVIAAVYLENCNNRHFFPEEQGGKKAFDQITAEVWDHFKKNV